MSSHHNLVPTPVTDKNGVATTRWKRPVGHSAGTAEIPAPAITKKSEEPVSEPPMDDELHSGIDAFLSDMLFRENASSRVVKVFREGLHPDTLGIIDEHYGSNYFPILQFVERCIRRESVNSLNNAAALIGMREECGAKSEVARDTLFEQTVFGLQWHQRLKEVDYSGSGKEAGEALIKAAINLKRPNRQFHNDQGYGSLYLPSRYLIELITERPNDVENIIGILNSRSIPCASEQDYDAISEMLDSSSAPSLTEGVL